MIRVKEISLMAFNRVLPLIFYAGVSENVHYEYLSREGPVVLFNINPCMVGLLTKPGDFFD